MIPLIIFILSIISFVGGVVINNNTPFGSKWHDIAWSMLIVGLGVGSIACMVTCAYAEMFRLYPVEYTMSKSHTHIAAVTDYGVFDSDKITDLTEWSQGKPGFIKVKYNVFGLECQRYTFVTNNTKE